MVLREKTFYSFLLGRYLPHSLLWVHHGCLDICPHKPITHTPKAIITEGHYKIAYHSHYFCLPLTAWRINQYSYNVAVFLLMAYCTCFRHIISIVAEICGRLPIILPQCTVSDEAVYWNAMPTCIINSSLFLCFRDIKKSPHITNSAFVCVLLHCKFKSSTFPLEGSIGQRKDFFLCPIVNFIVKTHYSLLPVVIFVDLNKN